MDRSRHGRIEVYINASITTYIYIYIYFFFYNKYITLFVYLSFSIHTTQKERDIHRQLHTFIHCCFERIFFAWLRAVSSHGFIRLLVHIAALPPRTSAGIPQVASGFFGCSSALASGTCTLHFSRSSRTSPDRLHSRLPQRHSELLDM